MSSQLKEKTIWRFISRTVIFMVYAKQKQFPTD